MSLHKMKDGERIDLSQEEEKNIRDEWEREKAESKKNEYINKRKSEYPTIDIQLDMMYDDIEKYGLLNLRGSWYNTIREVKEKNPKP